MHERLLRTPKVRPCAGSTWVDSASDHAIVTRDELLQWLKIGPTHLRKLVLDQGFPPPRYQGETKTGALTSRARWRVGDVRGWLESERRLKRELAVELRAEHTSNRPDMPIGKSKLLRIARKQ